MNAFPSTLPVTQPMPEPAAGPAPTPRFGQSSTRDSFRAELDRAVGDRAAATERRPGQAAHSSVRGGGSRHPGRTKPSSDHRDKHRDQTPDLLGGPGVVPVTPKPPEPAPARANGETGDVEIAVAPGETASADMAENGKLETLKPDAGLPEWMNGAGELVGGLDRQLKPAPEAVSETQSASSPLETNAAVPNSAVPSSGETKSNDPSEGAPDATDVEVSIQEGVVSAKALLDPKAAGVEGTPLAPAAGGPEAAREVKGDFHGTGAAQQSSEMQNASKQDQIAAQTAQMLPGVQKASARFAAAAPVTHSEPGTTDFQPPNAMIAAAVSRGLAANAATEDFSTGETSAARNATFVQLAGGLTSEVRIFRNSRAERLDVVLAPDRNTEISLRLQYRDGQVEMRARCDHGNFQALSAHWPRLQETLAQQGVKLLPLNDGDSTGGQSFSGFSGSHREGRPNPAELAHPFESLPSPLRNVMPQLAPGATPRSTQLFDSWA